MGMPYQNNWAVPSASPSALHQLGAYSPEEVLSSTFPRLIVPPSQHEVRDDETVEEHTCAYCDQSFGTRDMLEDHEVRQHWLVDQFRCKCGKADDLSVMVQHWKDCDWVSVPKSTEETISPPLEDYIESVSPRGNTRQNIESNINDKIRAYRQFVDGTRHEQQEDEYAMSISSLTSTATMTSNTASFSDFSTADEILRSTSPQTCDEVAPSAWLAPSTCVEGLKPIIFIDGDDEMVECPASIVAFLVMLKTSPEKDLSDYIRGKWAVSTLAGPRGYTEAHFINPETSQVLPAARYRYGPNSQFIVVQQHNGYSTALRGTPTYALVTFSRSLGTLCELPRTLLQEWQLHNIDDSDKSGASPVLRLCCKDETPWGNLQQPLIRKIVEVYESRCEEEITSNPNSDSIDGPIEDPVTPPPKTTRQIKNPQTYGRHVTDKSSRCGDTMQKVATILRESDDNFVKIICQDCGKSDFASVVGARSHCLAMHGRRFDDNQDIANFCGVILRGIDVDATGQAPSTPRAQLMLPPITPMSNVQRRTVAQKTRRASLSIKVNDPFVVFHDRASAEKTRVRPFSACIGVDKFFAHAYVANTIDQGSFLASVRVGDGDPMLVMREDEEDFQEVIAAVYDTATDMQDTITVHPAPLFE